MFRATFRLQSIDKLTYPVQEYAILHSIMIKEIPLHATYAEKKFEPKPNAVNTLVAESINLLRNLGYYKMLNSEREKNEGRIDFARKIKKGYRYPRFHISLVIPTQIPQFTITSFHIDRSQHKTNIDISKKNDEVRRLIDALEKEKEDATRNELLSLFKYELLFGNIRELNNLKGKTQEGRFGQLLKDRRREKLQGKNKHRWAKKNGREHQPNDCCGTRNRT